ncbi:hypothetical protein QYF36_023736 [Acer negundo]|nr:hypothetical protein QYF36_023736 [Acer negundo]
MVFRSGDSEPFINGKPVAEDIKRIWEEETYKYLGGSGLMGNGGKNLGKWKNGESDCGGNFGLWWLEVVKEFRGLLEKWSYQKIKNDKTCSIGMQ